MPPARLPAVLSLSLLAACAQQPKHLVTLEEQDDCPLKLHAGQVLMLSLPSSPTTGYRWQIQNAAQPVLRSLGPEVYSNSEDRNTVGSAGQSVWRYQAKTAGTGQLLMVYQQPWAQEIAPEQTFDCAITVE
jgi:inhibitor of cysteine peptidase